MANDQRVRSHIRPGRNSNQSSGRTKPADKRYTPICFAQWLKILRACQVLIIRESRMNPTSSTRFFATQPVERQPEGSRCNCCETLDGSKPYSDFKELMEATISTNCHSAEAIPPFLGIGTLLIPIPGQLASWPRTVRKPPRIVKGEARAWLFETATNNCNLIGFVRRLKEV